jgi:hypothetical protein
MPTNEEIEKDLKERGFTLVGITRSDDDRPGESTIEIRSRLEREGKTVRVVPVFDKKGNLVPATFTIWSKKEN